MEHQLMTWVMNASSALGHVLVMAALGLLWSRFKSSWLLVALAGAGMSLLMRLFFVVAPMTVVSMPALSLGWYALSLVQAAGWLGFALVQTSRHGRFTDPKTESASKKNP